MTKGQQKEASKTSSDNPIDNTDISDVTKALSILDKNVVRTSPFGANRSGEASYKKAERISAAIHLVTNHVAPTEPLRTSVRRESVHLLEVLLELRTGFQTTASEKGQEALAGIRQLISLVRMLAIASHVSTSNASVIVEALDELGTLIVTSQRSVLSEQLAIVRSDLVPPVHASVSSSSRATNRTSFHSGRTTRVISRASNSARADQIMGILKLGGALGIKDIGMHVPQYSEKMVQRELAEMVKKGHVRKVGAKRWSKYQIVQ